MILLLLKSILFATHSTNQAHESHYWLIRVCYSKLKMDERFPEIVGRGAKIPEVNYRATPGLGDVYLIDSPALLDDRSEGNP